MNYDFSPLVKGSHLNARQATTAIIVLVVVLLLLLPLASTNTPAIGVVIQLVIFGGILIGGVYVLLKSYRYGRAVEVFAARNNLMPLDNDMLLGLIPPCMQGVGHSERAHNGYSFELGTGQQCVVFEYAYTVGDGRSQRRYNFTLAELQKPNERFPHLFLVGHHTGVPHPYDASQQLKLEGDFDNYFALYAPDNADVDALTLFTPDVMQTLITAGRPYDLEIWNDDVWAASAGHHYTREQLPALLAFMGAFNRELNQEAVDWSPVAAAAMPATNLKRYRFGSPLHLALTAGIIIVYVIFELTIKK